MDEAIHVKIVEALESLLEYAPNDVLFHTTGPAVPHYIGGTSFVHETQGNVQLVAVHPRATDTKDIGVL